MGGGIVESVFGLLSIVERYDMVYHRQNPYDGHRDGSLRVYTFFTAFTCFAS